MSERGFDVRAARDEDVGGILEIYGHYVRETSVSFEYEVPTEAEMLERLRAARVRHLWIVATDVSAGAERLVGYAYAGTFRARVAYRYTAETTVYVRSGQHRRGVGRALMESLLEGLGSKGFHRAIAGITLPNEGSVRLHESLGFEPVGVFREVGTKFDQWHDAGFWQRAIDPRG